MATIASRDLRNHTGEVLRTVADGQCVTVTVHGEPIAEVRPVQRRRTHFRRAELLAILAQHQADPALTTTLAELAGETTDDLDPL